MQIMCVIQPKCTVHPAAHLFQTFGHTSHLMCAWDQNYGTGTTRHYEKKTIFRLGGKQTL
eukprot:COSAG02_NODE_948_length_15709_cov_67.728700_18_plen_60_part_00